MSNPFNFFICSWSETRSLNPGYDGTNSRTCLSPDTHVVVPLSFFSEPGEFSFLDSSLAPIPPPQKLRSSYSTCSIDGLNEVRFEVGNPTPINNFVTWDHYIWEQNMLLKLKKIRLFRLFRVQKAFTYWRFAVVHIAKLGHGLGTLCPLRALLEPPKFFKSPRFLL